LMRTLELIVLDEVGDEPAKIKLTKRHEVVQGTRT
jgi:hypothetical protein